MTDSIKEDTMVWIGYYSVRGASSYHVSNYPPSQAFASEQDARRWKSEGENREVTGLPLRNEAQ